MLAANPTTQPAPGGVDAFASAHEMLRALRAKELSAVELLELHLARIARYNPALNAVVVQNEAEARQMALAADQARARGEERPLLGLPLTIKDCVYVRGLPVTGGDPAFAQQVSEVDSPAAGRLRAAGVVIMGKTNVPPWAADWQSDNPIFGRTNNPWNLDYTPGGSSGGAAAVVAAGLSPLELGGDLGGSIRIPATFCGIYGHKPSETLVPRSGHFPAPPFPNPVVGMGVQGPLARTVEDLELALAVIAGPEVGEEMAWHVALPPARHERLADFRVAIMPPIPWLPVAPALLAAQEALAQRLRDAGATVGSAQPEGLHDLRDYYRLYRGILAVVSSVGRPTAERRAEAEALRATGNVFASEWADGLVADAGDYILWYGQREQYRAAYRDFFRQWDILLAPATIVPAFPHMALPWTERGVVVDGQTVAYDFHSVYPSLCNLSGHPGTAFPVGQSEAGLPLGLQAIGPYLEDRTPLRFAGLVAEAFGGFQRPPGYDA